MDTRFTRRQVFGGSARLGLALACGVPLLQACGDSGGGSKKQTKAIADGLEPEAGPLRIFNYNDYVSPDIVSGFEAQYGVKVEVTTITTDEEAITKLASGAIDVDLDLSVATDTLYKLVESGLIQPLNKTYLTNIGNVAAALRDPYYDKGGVYTVPYTVFGTGIGFRADKVDPASVSWETLWNPEYKGVTSILDNYREGLAMAMLRKGLTDVNTQRPGGDQAGRRRPRRAHRPDEHQGRDRGLQQRAGGRDHRRPHLEWRHARPESGTCRKVPGPRCSGTGSPNRRSSTTTRCAFWPRPRTRCSPTSSSTTCSTRPTPRRTSATSAISRPSKGSAPTS